MAQRLEAAGARRVVPTSADEDGLVTAIIPTDSSVVFEAFMATGDIVLSTDAPVPVPFGPAVGSAANYLVIRVKGGRVDTTIVSPLGTATIPVEPRLELRSDNMNLTSLSLQRPVGVEVTVNVYLGRRA